MDNNIMPVVVVDICYPSDLWIIFNNWLKTNVCYEQLWKEAWRSIHIIYHIKLFILLFTMFFQNKFFKDRKLVQRRPMAPPCGYYCITLMTNLHEIDFVRRLANDLSKTNNDIIFFRL